MYMHSNEENTAWFTWFTSQPWWLSCRSESSISFAGLLFEIVAFYFLKVFCRLRPPKDSNNDQQQTENSSSCIKVASSTELVLYSSEVSNSTFLTINTMEVFVILECKEWSHSRSRWFVWIISFVHDFSLFVLVPLWIQSYSHR